MISLYCAFVGVAGSAFSVDIDANKSVGHLKKAIKAEISDVLTLKNVPANNLQLFLAKKGDTWLELASEDVFEMQKGGIPDGVLEILREQISSTELVVELFGGAPTTKVIHILVKLPTSTVITAGGDGDADSLLELKRYQRRGVQIQRNCSEYCERILDKIDSISHRNGVLPFICVVASSGMGKSQLAFALGGRGPWFYWPATSIGVDSQPLYKKFVSIAEAFDKVTKKDELKKKSEVDILNCISAVYSHEKLWIYGFILTLLTYYDELEHDSDAGMIYFEKKMSLEVEKCDRDAVLAFRDKLKRDGKAVPFFVLDELTASKCQDEEGEKYAAFQRNVFRACGLVVLVMGTDAKIAKLTHQSGGSSGDPHMWMTVFSRFPPYQPIRFEDEVKQAAWDRIRAHYPVLKTIVEHSRGRFVRHFVDRATVYAMEKSHTFDLRDLLDDAFCYVRTRAEETKRFMSKPEGRNAQMMAMSNVDAIETSEPETKRRRIASGIQSMHSHFANLADSQHTDVYVSQGELTANSKEWLPLCSFPTIREDVLLYLAVLGGKTYSGYYNESVWRVFSLWKK